MPAGPRRGQGSGRPAEPEKEELPRTLRRSPRKARETYVKTLSAAHEEYDSEERAHRTAYASLKHSFEKVGDHWEPKKEKGPSDSRAELGQRPGGESAGGVDVNGHTRAELYERARQLGVPGRSSMSKMQLGQAIARRQG